MTNAMMPDGEELPMTPAIQNTNTSTDNQTQTVVSSDDDQGSDDTAVEEVIEEE